MQAYLNAVELKFPEAFERSSLGMSIVSVVWDFVWGTFLLKQGVRVLFLAKSQTRADHVRRREETGQDGPEERDPHGRHTGAHTSGRVARLVRGAGADRVSGRRQPAHLEGAARARGVQDRADAQSGRRVPRQQPVQRDRARSEPLVEPAVPVHAPNPIGCDEDVEGVRQFQCKSDGGGG